MPGGDGESDGKIVVQAVIGHFSSRWDTFIKGMEDNFKNFTKMLDDPVEGLVVRMKSVEEMVSEITDGKDGKKGLSETLQNFETRISSIEANNSDAPTEQTEQQPVITAEKLKEIDDKIESLEKENNRLKAIVDDLAEIDEKKNVKLKHFDFVEMKADIEHLKYFQETTSGFLTITEKRIDSMDSRVIANTANSMRNSIIFGGVRVQEEESVVEAVKRFLLAFMKLTPKNYDIYDAEKLGKGYTKVVKGREINFPPPVKVRCSEYFAAKIMGSANLLGGRQDPAEGFKYYVKRSRRKHRGHYMTNTWTM